MGIYLYNVTGATFVSESGSDYPEGNDADVFNYTVDVNTGETVTFQGDFGASSSATSGGSTFYLASTGSPVPAGTLVVNSDGTFTYTVTRAELDANGGNQTITFSVTGLDGTTDTDTVNLEITCFARGTGVTTPSGTQAVETLAIGDLVRTADGRDVPVKWIGRQTLIPGALDGRADMVRIAAGALGDGLPETDLTVTGDHGMIIDDLIVNASALVGARGVEWVPAADLPARFTVYHIETEDHDVILANGAPSETFVDYLGRSVFDNADTYTARYGAERIIPEQARPRISSRRLLPHAVKARLGMIAPDTVTDRSVA